MDRLLEIADRHGLAVIEDCAESHGATVRGRDDRRIRCDMGCFSFYANKIITTGEGGMVTHETTTSSPSGCGCCATSRSASRASYHRATPATTSG